MSKPSKIICFHCGEAVPSDETRTITIEGIAKPLCCAGCEMVAKLILDNGLENFYQFRDNTAIKPDIQELKQEWKAYDELNILEKISSTEHKTSQEKKYSDKRTAIFILENLYCGACAWLIKNTLSAYPGVDLISVNPATHRMRLVWNQHKTPLSHLLHAIAKLGYRPHPANDIEAQSVYLQEKRSAIKRLAVAGLGMMQVMMNAIAIYLDTGQVMDPDIKRYLILVSLLITTPVVLYAGKPFFMAAWRDIRHQRVGMDVPIALAIGCAYCASLWSALNDSGEVYFDSVCMFVFFLSLGRFAEMLIKHTLLYSQDAYSVLLPATASRIRNNTVESVALNHINHGDTILIKAGEVIPCDGTLSLTSNGQYCAIDESILSGESLPSQKQLGDHVIAGSINLSDCIQIRVTHTGQQTTLAHIKNLMETARTQKPKLVQFADQIAGKFVIGVLTIAVSVAVYWWLTQAELAFPIVLSVLVVTCPCALSLATPTALVAAGTRMAKSGLLLTQTDAIERLNKINHIMLDKTGTLSYGKVQLNKTVVLDKLNETQCRQIAAALELQAKHPIANAFTHIKTPHQAKSIKATVGLGIEGLIDQTRYRIGSLDYIKQSINTELQDDVANRSGSLELAVYLADEEKLLAKFTCSDRLRDEAADVIEQLKASNLKPVIASGDQLQAVQDVADQLNIEHYYGRMTPRAKLKQLQTLQTQGLVAMVGDGINDAPILAAADVSFAMNHGSSLAQSQADIILLKDNLNNLISAFTIAQKTKTIIRQNIIWAISYNMTAIPLAAAGFVAPWMAAIGMSLSSLLVVMNASRIKYVKPDRLSIKNSKIAYKPSIPQKTKATV